MDKVTKNGSESKIQNDLKESKGAIPKIKDTKSEATTKKSNNGSIRKGRRRSRSDNKQNSLEETEPARRNFFSKFNRSSKRKSNRKPIKNNEQNNQNDSTEADTALLNPPIEQPETVESNILTTRLVPTEPHAEKYFMNHTRRGKAVILNQVTFEKEDVRRGSEHDVHNLNTVLSELKFEIEVHHDLDYRKTLDLIDKLSVADYSDCDCILFFVLSHGNNKKEVSAKDVYYSIDKLWQPFTECITLAGKPKCFFISACRGRKKDSGIQFLKDTFSKGRTETDSGTQKSYKIPKHADFLIAYSTTDEHYAYRDPSSGTWFIQCFCKTLSEHYRTKDLLKILTITARRVAIDFHTIVDQPQDCELKQVPSIVSMLIRDLYFTHIDDD